LALYSYNVDDDDETELTGATVKDEDRNTTVFTIGTIALDAFSIRGIYEQPELTMIFLWQKNLKSLAWESKANYLLQLNEEAVWVDHRFEFSDLSNWRAKTLVLNLKKILQGSKDLMVEDENGDEVPTATAVILTLKEDSSGTALEFSLTVGGTGTKFGFADMSHRASLVMGYYDYDFKANWDNPTSLTQISPSKPLAHFGNMLYLVSNNGNVMYSTNCQNPSIIYRIQQVFNQDSPVLQKPLKSEREEIIADGSALREFKMTLTDRWLHPVKIKAPLVVTIKMRPIREDMPTYG
jgi:hypothetical protein